ncbi:uncharacterized protein J4E88_004945 [Alternaria novae-zelandiae]|uniref:uncharacterized protein n=1 Tax=Alternaria novae-zelandiae TaxID=430562 RepID=UPI0020C347AE|nr:uncharacterized protein J4E88_004945 [Alternaria novae-zelandiae]KAI4682057.1 hypothetical protein J4E88_004945 [Alternaria novae-zelandiae]
MLAAQRTYIVAIATFVIVATLSFYAFRDQGVFVVARITRPSSNLTLRDTVASLFAPIKHDPSSTGYVDPSGTYYEGGRETIWTKPLGKKVLIVDIDTRVPTGENELLNPERLDWENLKTEGAGLVSNSIMNHYLYAMVHGYDYKFYQARDMKDHYNTWILPHVLRELIPEYQFVVVMDADVTIAHPDVPFEWMFNRWGIKQHTSIALPWDTEEIRDEGSISLDSKGMRVLNTGLVVAQNSSTTLELLDAWRDCTSETRYKGCAKWRYEWSHEQRAFSEYIRYDFNKTPETIVTIPCDDAVGWPGFRQDMLSRPGTANRDISDCNGNFVRHYTTMGKTRVKDASASSVMQMFSDALQKSILANPSEVWYKEPEKKTEMPKEQPDEVREDVQSKSEADVVLIER